MAWDSKYGTVTIEKGTIGVDEPVFVVRAQDALAPKLLTIYADMCAEAGSPVLHVAGVLATKMMFESWQARNPTKVPESA